MNKAITQKRIDDINTRKTILRILIATLVLLCLSYVYFIGSITFNILARKSLELSRKEIGNNVSQIELEYIKLSNSINATYGSEVGFVDAQNTIFASRTKERVALK